MKVEVLFDKDGKLYAIYGSQGVAHRVIAKKLPGGYIVNSEVKFWDECMDSPPENPDPSKDSKNAGVNEINK